MQDKRILNLAVLMGCVVSCKTTNPYSRVDEKSGEVSLYSTTDERSTLAANSKDEAMEKAAKNLEEATKKEPNRRQSWLNLASVYVAQGRLDKAEYAAKQVLRTDVSNKEAKKILAEIAVKKGNADLAEIHLNALGGDSSKDSQVLNLMALVALQRDEPSAAMRLFKEALNLEPGNISVRMNLGVAYLKFRQLRQASVQFERVLKLMPNNSDALLHLAIIKGTQGQREQAVDMYRQVLADNKTNPLALYNLAVLQKQSEDYDGAVDNLKTYLNTAHAKNSDTDQVFALIEEIKDLQAQKGNSTIDDSEIKSLAAKLHKRDRETKRTAEAGLNASPTKAESPSKKAPAVEEKVPEQNEIDALEKALLQ